MKSKEDNVSGLHLWVSINVANSQTALQSTSRATHSANASSVNMISSSAGRSRRPRLVYGDASPTQPHSQVQQQQQQSPSLHDSKGLGISSNANNVGSGGIRSGMASLGLTPSNNSNHESSSAGGSSNLVGSSRIAANRRNRRA